MRRSSVDRVAIALASGVSRRDMFRYIFSAAAVAGVAAANSRRAGAQDLVRQRAVSLRLGVPGARGTKHVLVHVPDRYPAKVWSNDSPNRYSFVPHILENGEQVDVSIYDVTGSPKLLDRVRLPIATPKGSTDARQIPITTSALAGWSMAALWARTISAPLPPSPEDDCCVEQCCNGPGGCAPAVCCDPSDWDCGNCCDVGWCPACS